MSATIDVLVVFDAATILANNTSPSQDPNNPSGVGGNIFMIVDAAHANGDQAGSELNVKAQTGDTIRWREATVAPTDYQALMYAFQAGQQNLISPPTPIQITVHEPFPNPATPSVPQFQTVQNFFWNSTVENPGTLTYHFNFMLVDR
ncbi:MAG TPA: AidA/PixA family protein, partial [Longimicrobium sp.]|nr:AidA/PixA family protein [Longimicrobium sp.]